MNATNSEMEIDRPSHEGERSGGDDRVVFLVGAGRSGTTLLYKLLSLHPKVAFISNYDVRAPWLLPGTLSGRFANKPQIKLGSWFNKGGNAYLAERPWAKRLIPMPVEGERLYARHGLPLIPDEDFRLPSAQASKLRAQFERIRRASGAEILLAKRTANNRRIAQLHAVWPRAKYVHLIRDGRDVANSLSRVEWWDDHHVWWDGRTPLEMERAGMSREQICATNWLREIEILKSGLQRLDANRILETRYEQLLTAPVAELGRLLEFIGVAADSSYFDAIRTLNLHTQPPVWRSAWSESQLQTVLNVQGELLMQLGYR